MYPRLHYQEGTMPIVLSYRGDLEVTVEIYTEVDEELHIVLDRKNAADLKNMLDIWLDK
jgi:hypothetical protein